MFTTPETSVHMLDKNRDISPRKTVKSVERQQPSRPRPSHIQERLVTTRTKRRTGKNSATNINMSIFVYGAQEREVSI